MLLGKHSCVGVKADMIISAEVGLPLSYRPITESNQIGNFLLKINWIDPLKTWNHHSTMHCYPYTEHT